MKGEIKNSITLLSPVLISAVKAIPGERGTSLSLTPDVKTLGFRLDVSGYTAFYMKKLRSPRTVVITLVYFLCHLSNAKKSSVTSIPPSIALNKTHFRVEGGLGTVSCFPPKQFL
jgi:hypothetical protein